MRRGHEENSRKKKSFLPGVMIAAFVAAAITFFLLLYIEKSVLSEYEKEVVWVARADLQKSLEISAANLPDCFRQEEIEKTKVPAYAVKEINQLEGTMAAILIPEGSVITEPMFREEESSLAFVKQPVIAGCKAEDLYQFVSGTLRKGDRINIYTVNEEMKETYLLWENIVIYQTFDSAGNVISPEDQMTAAARINLLLEEENVEQFYNEMYKGSLRMVKVWE